MAWTMWRQTWTKMPESLFFYTVTDTPDDKGHIIKTPGVILSIGLNELEYLLLAGFLSLV